MGWGVCASICAKKNNVKQLVKKNLAYCRPLLFKNAKNQKGITKRKKEKGRYPPNGNQTILSRCYKILTEKAEGVEVVRLNKK